MNFKMRANIEWLVNRDSHSAADTVRGWEVTKYKYFVTVLQ